MDARLHAKILSMIPLFRTLLPDELREIMSMSKLLRVPRGVMVVEEGEDATAMYILVEGKGSVTKRVGGEDKTQLATLKAPTVFGEMSLIDRAPRSATVTTQSDCVLFQINLRAFNRLRAAYHPAAYKVLREIAPTMCGRLREVNERVGEFFKNPEQSFTSIDEEVLSPTAAPEA
jgi:CRP-like cAMP-binding protein